MNEAPVRTGRADVWLLAVLLSAFLSLAVYHAWHRAHSAVNGRLLKELENDALDVAASGPLGKPGDWPQWRGPRRDGMALDVKLWTDWPAEGPRVVWEAPVGAGFSSPVISENRFFLLYRDGDQEVLTCRNAGSGAEFWRYHYPCTFHNEYGGGGPRSTPAVDGVRVYTVGAAGVLLCMNAETGQVVWRRDLLQEFEAPTPQWGVSFSPLIEGNRLFVMPGGTAGAVAAFDKVDGRLLWKSLDDPAGYASPVGMTVEGTRHIVFLTGHSLVGVSPRDGHLLWRYPWVTSSNCNIATPIVRGDYVFVSSGYGKGCALLKIVAEGGKFEAQLVYEHKQMRNHFSSSVLAGRHIFGFDEQALTCMEFRTGKVVWTERRAFGKGSLLAASDRVLVVGEAGQMGAIEATGDAYRPLAKHRFSQRTQCWAAPALAQGKLYLRDDEKVVCLDLTKP